MTSGTPGPEVLEPPTHDDRILWDIHLYSNVLPAIGIAVELGLFTLLDSQPRSTEEVATELSLDHDWAEVLLATLGAMRLARALDGLFHLTDLARDYLLPGSPYYRGSSLRRFAELNPAERLRQSLTETSSGNPRYVVREWKAGDLSMEVARRTTETMHGLSFAAAVGMARNADFQGVTRLLDVAGGSGGFGIAIAQRHSGIRCTIADLDVVCELAQEYIDRYGVSSQVDTHTMNMFFDDWPGGYDAVLFSCVLHDWGPEQRTELLRRAYKALPSGGRVYIHEMLMNDTADGPIGPALLGLNMHIGTGGKQFTAPELHKLLKAEGFHQVTVQNTFGYFSVVIGCKP